MVIVIYGIIPCYNESLYIKEVLREACLSDIDKIIVVDNGSTDETLEILRSELSDKVNILYCSTPLGYDVPRAAGLHFALMEGGEYFVYLDGDMDGIKGEDINMIIKSLRLGVDLSLTDCYYKGELPCGLARFVVEYRGMLNQELNLFDKIKYSTPSHGPHGISRRLAASVPLQYVAVPPLLLCWAHKKGFVVEIGLNKLHSFLGSSERDERHTLLMAETIIGDCISGINYINSNTLGRFYEGMEYTGYHRDRRFDLLDLIIKDAALRE